MIYYKYFKYILEHKKNVFAECMDMAKEYWNKISFKKDNRKIARQLFIHAFTHDLSKFRPSEFIPYARYFYGKYPNFHDYKLIPHYNGKTKEDIKIDFEKAWELHYQRNKHHPEHWTGRNMPSKHIRQMICDLKAMSRKFGGTVQEYYLKNYYKWDVTRNTRYCLEVNLDLLVYNAPICECNEEYWMTIEELIKSGENFLNKNGYIRGDTVKNNINNLLKPACDKYNVDIYELVKRYRNK